MMFRYTILYVEEPATTVDFFERAFGLTRRFLAPEGEYGELETGGTTLAVSAFRLLERLGKTPKRADPAAPVFEIAFEVDDVERALERATREGAQLVRPAEAMPWGQTIGYLATPDGVLVELCTAVAAS